MRGWRGIQQTPKGWDSKRRVEQQALLKAVVESLWPQYFKHIPYSETEVTNLIRAFLEEVACQATAAALADCLEAYMNHYRPFAFKSHKTNFAPGKLLQVRRKAARICGAKYQLE